ncbi:MAG: glycosyltransferase [Candidatus Hydrogenedentes bacterium]|nr:glycosyltransferase [Candidatus Hydrogenedentota bacterium]
MKICILNVLHGPFDKRMFHKVGMSLVAAGHEVVSICPRGEFSGPERDGIHFHYIPASGSKVHRLRALAYLFWLGRRARADLYLAPEPESWVAALLIKCTRRCRVVFDMHEHVPTEFAKFFPAFLREGVVWLTRRAMRGMARFTDYIILTRESFDFEWDGLSTPRGVVINSNHVQPRCNEVPDAIRKRIGEGPVVLHQGTFGTIRGSWQLLNAMKIVRKKVPGVRCVVLGHYAYGDFDKYKRAIERTGLSENFQLVDTVPYEEVPAWIAACDVGLILFQPGLVNHTLAMPHKLFDYMREAKPVVAPDFAIEVARIVDDAACGVLVEVTEARAIAKAIVRLLSDPALARRLGESGRKAVEDRYNWQHEEAKLLAAIQSLERG